jgi:hypothetical protein
MNPKGKVSILFATSEPVEVYMSDTMKKPGKKTAKKIIT